MPVARSARQLAPTRPLVDGTSTNSTHPAAAPRSATSSRGVVLKRSRGCDGVERVEPVRQVGPDDHVLVEPVADLAGVELEAGQRLVQARPLGARLGGAHVELHALDLERALVVAVTPALVGLVAGAGLQIQRAQRRARDRSGLAIGL